MRKWEARSELEMDVCNGCFVLWHCVRCELFVRYGIMLAPVTTKFERVVWHESYRC